MFWIFTFIVAFQMTQLPTTPTRVAPERQRPRLLITLPTRTEPLKAECCPAPWPPPPPPTRG